MSERVLSASRGSERFSERRKKRRLRVLVGLVIFLIILLAGAIYGLRQSAVRISRVQVFGADASFAGYATDAMQGSYLGIIPRDSIFFFPESRIRARILAEHPQFAALSVFREGMTGISLKFVERVAVVKWCGLSYTEGVDAYCYLADAGGFLFGAASDSSQFLNRFTLYAPLVGDTLEPLRATIAPFEELPHIFDFARQMDALGSQAERITVHNGEVDIVLSSGTRLSYLLGDEQNAFTALVSGRENFNLTDGSVEYIDLRFGEKMYLKRREAPK